MTDENLSISDVLQRKDNLKRKGLRRREITDKLLKECLDRLSIEDRYRVLYYYMMDDIGVRADS